MITIHQLGLALLHFLWQGAAIAIVARLAFHFSRKPETRYLAGIVGLGAMPVVMIVTLLSVGPRSNAAPTLREERTGSAANPSQRKSGISSPRLEANEVSSPPPRRELRLPVPDARQLKWIVTAWLAGVLLMSARLLGGWTFARRLLRKNVAPLDEWQAVIDRLRERLGIRRAVRVLESAVATAPSVVGWLRPVILLPVSVLSGLTPRQVEILIAHELAHVRRHDYLMNLLQSALESFLFYHPAVWWLSARVREDRELCCDDLAIRATGDPREYAETLFALERLRVFEPPIAMAATGGHLLNRIRRLVAPDEQRTETFPRWVAGALVLVILTAAGVSGPLSRLFAQAPVATIREDSAAGSGSVIAHPDASRSLTERMEWARSEARRRGDRRYWTVYTIKPLEWAESALYIGEGANIRLDNGESMFLGGIVSVGDPGQLNMAGEPLRPLFGGAATDIAVIQEFRSGSESSMPTDLTIASLSLAHDFEDRPIYWLGPAEDSESLALTRELYADAEGSTERSRYISLVGVHRTHDLVVPELTAILQSRESTSVRAAAAEWLGRHPRLDALRALDAAARNDHSVEVQREAAESVGEMKLPEAFDVLVKLSHELENFEARREAVESLGDRPEDDAARTLEEIAMEDDAMDVRREAAESLGNLSGARGLPSLRKVLEDGPDDEVRAEAAETIGDLGQQLTSGEAIRLLSAAIENDRSSRVQREAVETLGDLKDPSAVATLAEVAERHPDEGVRQEAVETLGDYPDEAIAIFRRLLENEPSENVLAEIFETAVDLDTEEGAAFVAEQARKHPDRMVRQMAVQALEDH